MGGSVHLHAYPTKDRGAPRESSPVAPYLPHTGVPRGNVGETSGLRPSPLKTYKIGLGAGIVPNTSVAKGCTTAQANAQVLPALCLKKATSGGAMVGGGSVSALAGPTTNTSTKLPCYLKVTLVNSTKKNHMWIRVDGVTTGAPGKTCVTAQHSSIDSTFVRTGSAPKKGGGTLPIYAIKFTVPPGLLHPLPGFDVAVVGNVSNIAKISKRIGRTATWRPRVARRRRSASAPA